MRLNTFEYFEPRTLDETISLLGRYDKRVRIKAGGTSLIPSMKQDLAAPEYLVNISSLADLAYIEFDPEGGLRIGAAVTLHEILSSSMIAERYAGLAEAVGSVSSVSMHYRSTLGGNICQDTRCSFYNQSREWRSLRPKCLKAGGDQCLAVPGNKRCSAVYRGDIAPVLMCMEASVKLSGMEEERSIPLTELFTGNGVLPNRIKSKEILAEVRIPPPAAGTVCVYEKARIRASLDYPIAGVGILVVTDENGTCSHASIVITALGCGPMVPRDAVDVLVGAVPDKEHCLQAAEMAEKAVRPVDNTESTPEHRRKMARELVYRGLARAFALHEGGG